VTDPTHGDPLTTGADPGRAGQPVASQPAASQPAVRGASQPVARGPTRLVRVELAERGYDIQIGAGLLAGIGPFIAARRKLSHAVIITDSRVQQPHATAVAASLDAAGARVDMLVVEPGEKTKSLRVVGALWNKLLDIQTDRHSVVVAVGGGVIGDLAGFAAAGYARGISLFQVPTTLLAQVDSSVGGKVGVNLPDAKNMVGAFWQPSGVLIDTDTLSTLPVREYVSGLAEVVKYGVILDADFFVWLERNSAHLHEREDDALRHIVARSCELKAAVVRQDEREETGARAVLNYGHTFAHAFETASGYGQLLHGEAVSIGMMCAARLAQRLGRIEESLVRRQRELLLTFGLPVTPPPLRRARLMELMARDKKVEHGRLRFVLPSRLGHVELVGDISEEDVQAAMES
jgi:3-dehydroquinate synthase